MHNWIWPRYTGDFSLFRIYADPKQNKPTLFSKENVPYKPKKVIPISTKGVKEDDFTWILGFPGGTQKNVTSKFLSSFVDREFPFQVSLLNLQLDLWAQDMKQTPESRFKYEAAYASYSNVKKKLEGIIEGCRTTDAVSQKRKKEELFIQTINSDTILKSQYGTVIDDLDNMCDSIKIYKPVYMGYLGLNNIKLMKIAEYCQSFLNRKEGYTEKDLQFLLSKLKIVFQNFDWSSDRELFIRMMNFYRQNVDKNFYFSNLSSQAELDIRSWGEDLYRRSNMISYDKLEKTLLGDPQKLLEDPIMPVVNEFSNMLNEKVWPFYPKLSTSVDSLYRKYEQACIDISTIFNTPIWPDGNGGMRLSYGKVKGYSFQDMTYSYSTTLKQMIDQYEYSCDENFTIPSYLKKLSRNKWVAFENIPVCFITNSQTSSGNSGSPVFNGKGELVGLNFDRNWEGTMSDYWYSPDLSRNIVLDVRYMLFVLEQFSGATRIVNELILN